EAGQEASSRTRPNADVSLGPVAAEIQSGSRLPERLTWSIDSVTSSPAPGRSSADGIGGYLSGQSRACAQPARKAPRRGGGGAVPLDTVETEIPPVASSARTSLHRGRPRGRCPRKSESSPGTAEAARPRAPRTWPSQERIRGVKGERREFPRAS